jgi:hypothetical protein
MALTSYVPVLKPTTGSSCRYCSNEKLKFLDIVTYLAPGFSYSQYLKAYKYTEQKGFFPYEWMTSMDKLNVSQLPPQEAFFSTLKNENISAEDYHQCQRVWEDKDSTPIE